MDERKKENGIGGTSNDFWRKMPKADLHVHLIGAVRPATVLALAEKNHHVLQDTSVGALQTGRQGLSWDSGDFVPTLRDIKACFSEPEDFERLTWEMLEDAASDGVRYVEARVNWQYGAGRDLTNEILEAVESARRSAERAFGIKARWITDFPMWEAHSDRLAEDCAAFASKHRDTGLVGIDAVGIGQVEASMSIISSALRRAKAEGVHVVGHAGEVGGPEEVWAAVKELQVERIAHGLAVSQDPKLLEMLAACGTPIEVCVTSNVHTGRVRRAEEHPVRIFLNHGVRAVVCSDDPMVFQTTLSREYEVLHSKVGLSVTDLIELGRQGFVYSFLEDEEKKELLQAFDVWEGYHRIEDESGAQGA